jgi:hypothetical protein
MAYFIGLMVQYVLPIGQLTTAVLAAAGKRKGRLEHQLVALFRLDLYLADSCLPYLLKVPDLPRDPPY